MVAESLKPRIAIADSDKDSSSETSSSESADLTPRFGKNCSKTVMRKRAVPYIPRLDLTQATNNLHNPTNATVLKMPLRSAIRQNNTDLRDKDTTSRRTARRTDSARLISMTDCDDHLGLALASIDSTRSIIPRTKSRSKSGEFLQKEGGKFAQAGADGLVNLCGKNGKDAVTAAEAKSKDSLIYISEPGKELFLYMCQEKSSAKWYFLITSV